MASLTKQNKREEISIIERKLNYLLDHPELQRRYPVRYEQIYDRLIDRWCEYHKTKTIHLNTS